MIICELTDKTKPLWDEYVRQAPTGLPQHLAGWREVIAKTYNYKTRYLMAREDKRVVGVLPLFRVNSFLLGNVVRSMPGGLSAESPAAAGALIEQGKAWARRMNAQQFWLADTRYEWPGTDCATTSEYVYWCNDVRPGIDSLWRSLPGNVRRQVRLARSNNLYVTVDRTGELLNTFYQVFSHFAHRSGTPLFGRHFLENVIRMFPGGFNIAVVYQGQQPLGAYFQLQMQRTVYGVWGAALHQYLKLRPVYLAYWEILCDAVNNDYHMLDMGRSPLNSNSSSFKGQWGGISSPIFQLTASMNTRQQFVHPVGNGIKGKKYQIVSRCWPWLPLPIARYLGPKLRRHLPFA